MGWNEYALPTVAVTAGLPERTGGSSGSFVTFTANEGRQLRAVPLLTQMAMPAKVLAWYEMPESSPVDELKVAHQGLLVIEKVSLPPEGLFAVGWNLYWCACSTLVAGVPLMVGAVLARASGEVSGRARTSAQSAACRGHTAAVLYVDM